MTTTRAPSKIIPRAFPGITPDEVSELINNSKLANYPPETVLCRENAVEDTFYLILEGEVEVTKVINNAEARLLKTLGAGDFFGEMALIHNAPRAATVKTVTPLIALEIRREAFARVLKNSSSVSLAMVREISRRLRENDEMAIDDLRIRASELAEAYQKLAEQDVTRRDFLTNAAHQLRTPLMAAGGFLQMIQKGAIPPDKMPEAVDTVARNVQQIVALVNDILFVQEMELILGKFQPVNSVDLARETAAAYREKAEARKVDLRVKPDLFLPPITGDARSLERALSALVDNAVKFSPDGGRVDISIRRKGGQVAVAVSDNGIGIQPEVLPRIFDRFYHLDKSGDRLFEGLGLGLAIARQVVEQHKGRLTVDSTPGKGSTFTMWLNIWKEEGESEKEGGTTI
ncbi:MAG: signal transduction histidine kinase [Anaerolineaceae bacterium]|nr:MAG: signal transduction histidine kinase [Anaerolineaceae bacterium]